MNQIIQKNNSKYCISLNPKQQIESSNNKITNQDVSSVQKMSL